MSLWYDVLHVNNTTNTYAKVWEQGVFAPDFQYNEDVFQKKIAENPSVLHEFLVPWLVLPYLQYMKYYGRYYINSSIQFKEFYTTWTGLLLHYVHQPWRR